jgi:hypothetical protein
LAFGEKYWDVSTPIICWWVGGCYSYIRFDPSLAVS